MDAFITGLGLSSSAGLNTYLPLIIFNLAGRSEFLEMEGATADVLTSWPALIVFGILLVVEIVADKVPMVDSVNDVINTAVRPAVGAALMVATTSGLEGQIDPEALAALSVISGGISAGGVHAVKATTRPAVTASTGGLGNAIVSTIEDIISLMMALTAIILPFILLFFVVSFVVLFLWWLWEMNRQDRLERHGIKLK